MEEFFLFHFSQQQGWKLRVPREALGFTDQHELWSNVFFIWKGDTRGKAREEYEMQRSYVRVAFPGQGFHFLPGPSPTRSKAIHTTPSAGVWCKAPIPLLTSMVEPLLPLEWGREMKCPSASSRCPCSLPQEGHPPEGLVCAAVGKAHNPEAQWRSWPWSQTQEQPAKRHSSIAWGKRQPRVQ